MSNLFKMLPAVDFFLKELDRQSLFKELPHNLLKELINDYLNHCRERIKQGEIKDSQDLESDRLLQDLVRHIKRRSRPNFRRVLNATGVVVHTNLGRSLLAEEAIEAIHAANSFYSNLEFDLSTGKRGSRYSLVEDLLCRLTGAEAGLVVNNNAGGVLLMLDTLAKGQEVIVSRGQLVEIGGSFRIPEVMAKSGARLREVGATNRTHLHDYEQAIGSETAALLKAHTSNYKITGFFKEVELKELVELGERYGLPVLEDLGSGNFFDFPDFTGLREPTVQNVLKQGVSVVCFSGDKLLGAPQAGIILGKKQYIEKIKKNPLNRALRIDKMTLAGLEATLRLYLDKEKAGQKVPTLKMICTSPETLRKRSRELASLIKSQVGEYFQVNTKKAASRVGGGASPELDLPTYLVQLKPKLDLSLDKLRSLLLDTDPPLIGRVEEEAFCLDSRTLQRKELKLIPMALEQAVNEYRQKD